MKKEIRTRIADPDDAIWAAFQLFASILGDPSSFPKEFSGASFRPVERIEEQLPGDHISGQVSFEVTLTRDDEPSPALPEMERVLVPA